MNKIPVIIDCDTGIDDMISFAVTLTSDKLNILGITTAAGNQVVDITTQNTLNGVTIMGRTDIPVAEERKNRFRDHFGMPDTYTVKMDWERISLLKLQRNSRKMWRQWS